MRIAAVLCINETDSYLLRKKQVLRNWGRRLRRLDGIADIVVAVPAALAAETSGIIARAGWRLLPGANDQLLRLAEAVAAGKLTAVLRLTPDNLLVPDELLEDLLTLYRRRACRAAITAGFPTGIAAAVIGAATLRALCRQGRQTGRMPHPMNALCGMSGVFAYNAEPRYWNRMFAQWPGAGKVIVRGRGDRVPGLNLKPNTPVTGRWSSGKNTPPVAVMVRQAVRNEVRRQLTPARLKPAPLRRRNILMLNHIAVAGGSEYSFLETAAGLCDRRWQVHLGFLTPGMMATRAKRSGLTTAILGPGGEPWWPAQLRLAKYLDANRIDVVYVNSAHALPAVLLPALERRLRLVLHVREFLDPAAIHDLSLGAVSTIIANSQATAAHLAGYVDPAKLQVMPNCIDADRVRAAVGTEPQLQRQHEFYFGVFGRVVPYKGQHTAVQALRLLREQGCDAGLVLAGSGFNMPASVGYENHLRSLIRAYRLERHVLWFDHLENPFALMAQVDAVAVPTEGEPFGRVILEALALGKPVIATADGGPSEILPASRLIPSADPAALARALLGIYSDAPPRPTAAAILARFTLPRYLDRLEKVLAGRARARDHKPRRNPPRSAAE